MVRGSRRDGSYDAAAETRLVRRLGSRLFPLLLLLLFPPASSESQKGQLQAPIPATGPGLSVYMSQEEVLRLIGIDAELYYVRNDLINHFALSFNLQIPVETNSLHFTWHAKSKIEYKLGFQVDNLLAMDMPHVNISAQGEVPRMLSDFTD